MNFSRRRKSNDRHFLAAAHAFLRRRTIHLMNSTREDSQAVMERITYLHRYRVVADATGASVVVRRSGAAVTCKAVSYTHLTLPTILRV